MKQWMRLLILPPALAIGCWAAVMNRRAMQEEELGPLPTLSCPLSPETTVIVFDIHGVLMVLDVLPLLATAWAEVPVIPLAYYGFNPFVWYAVVQSLHSSRIIEQVFDDVMQRFPGIAPLKPHLIRLYNTQKPLIGHRAVLERLKEKGYPLYILSNIGPAALADMQASDPAFWQLFDGLYIAQDCENCHKPYAIFYKAFLDYLAAQGHAHKQVIFIDDKPRNVAAARRAGIYALRYLPSYTLFDLLNSLC